MFFKTTDQLLENAYKQVDMHTHELNPLVVSQMFVHKSNGLVYDNHHHEDLSKQQLSCQVDYYDWQLLELLLCCRWRSLF